MCLKNQILPFQKYTFPSKQYTLCTVVFYQHLKNLEHTKSIILVAFLHRETPQRSVTDFIVPWHIGSQHRLKFSYSAVSYTALNVAYLIITMMVLITHGSSDSYRP